MLTFRIVLVEPIYSGNVGSVARVMKNFGFEELVLLNPCELDRPAHLMAVHAYDIIEKARIEFSLKDALKDSNIIVGMTGLPGKTDNKHFRIPAYSPKQLKEKLAGNSGVVSLVFGREDAGLRNEELEICDLIVNIPTSPIYPSMNLSHAVAIVLYELSDIENFRKYIDNCIVQVNQEVEFQERVLNKYDKLGILIQTDKGAVMRAMSQIFNRSEMQKVYTTIIRNR